LCHQLTTKQSTVVDKQARRLHARFDTAARDHLHRVVCGGASSKQASHLDVCCFDIGFNDAARGDHKLARERQRTAKTSGDLKFAFTTDAAFDGDSCFNSTGH
jgi:hypothetical protein